jgi:hypothetical protein
MYTISLVTKDGKDVVKICNGVYMFKVDGKIIDVLKCEFVKHSSDKYQSNKEFLVCRVVDKNLYYLFHEIDNFGKQRYKNYKSIFYQEINEIYELNQVGEIKSSSDSEYYNNRILLHEDEIAPIKSNTNATFSCLVRLRFYVEIDHCGFTKTSIHFGIMENTVNVINNTPSELRFLEPVKEERSSPPPPPYSKVVKRRLFF